MSELGHKEGWVLRNWCFGTVVLEKTLESPLDCEEIKPVNPVVVVAVQLLSCVWLCDPMDCSTPVLSVHHQFLEFTQTHVHWVSDSIQPSHPPLSPSPPAFNLPQHQGLFKWVSCSHQVAKVLELQLQHSPSSEYSRLVSFRNDWFDFLAVEGTLKSLLQHHHFESINSSALSFLYGPALTSLHDHWKNHSFEYRDLWWQSDVSAF